jgi:FkbM family methyltransferase
MRSVKDKARTYLSRRLGMPEIPNALERLARCGFNPARIFDVGAFRGDFARLCLQIWPDAQIFCFEPLPSRVKQLTDLASRFPAVQVIAGLVGAAANDRVAIHEMETASSVLEEHFEQGAAISFHPMRTIDQFVQAQSAPPDLLKLDVQGYELEVLKGAEQNLSNMQVILAELNFLDIHKGVPLIAEVITWLDQRDWVAYDVCGLTRRPLDQALWQADFLFVPRRSPLRANKRWAKSQPLPAR